MREYSQRWEWSLIKLDNNKTCTPSTSLLPNKAGAVGYIASNSSFRINSTIRADIREKQKQSVAATKIFPTTMATVNVPVNALFPIPPIFEVPVLNSNHTGRNLRYDYARFTPQWSCTS